MDVNRALRNATQSGKVHLGLKESLNDIAAKTAKLIVIASNAPEEAAEKVRELAEANGVPVYTFRGRNAELGPACGKPFSVAFASVLEAGESDVLQLAQ